MERQRRFQVFLVGRYVGSIYQLPNSGLPHARQSGEIRTEASLVANSALVTVGDTGIDMSEDVRLQVFNRFYQADLRERKSKAGSGLGLSIGGGIADAHCAELTVESIPQQGSVFQVKFQ